jgi:aminomethyltransferase
VTATPTLQRTALFDRHKALGAKMVPFAGWEMPVQYPTGILAEHHAVRSGAGIFDVSHMGEFEITGPDRNAFVNRFTCNDVGALQPGGVQYSAILTPEGTFVDDCTVYRFDDKLMIVVNASNTARAWEHIVAQKGGANVRLKDISSDVGLLSVQGPEAEQLLQPLTRTKLASRTAPARKRTVSPKQLAALSGEPVPGTRRLIGRGAIGSMRCRQSFIPAPCVPA